GYYPASHIPAPLLRSLARNVHPPMPGYPAGWRSCPPDAAPASASRPGALAKGANAPARYSVGNIGPGETRHGALALPYRDVSRQLHAHLPAWVRLHRYARLLFPATHAIAGFA